MIKTQGFPNYTTPLVDPATGLVAQPWYQYLVTLLNRTGGSVGPSLSLVMPGQFAVSGSPILGQNGTFTVTWATEAANTVLAGPSSGPAAAPTFRALVASDIPNGLPTGGTTGQVLGKTSNSDFAVGWQNGPASGLPVGGTTGQMLRKTSNTDYAASWQDTPLPIELYVPGVPAASAKTGRAVADACTFPANFSGSVGPSLAASTGTAVVVVNKISAGTTTQIGTATYTTSNQPTFATTGGLAQTLAVGDILEAVFPSPADATLADIFLTLRATRN